MAEETTLSDDQLLAQLQAQESTFEQRASEVAKKREIEALQMVQRARAKHPGEELLRVDTMVATFVMKAPLAYQYTRFRELSSDPSTKLQANEQLVAACLVEPDWDVFTAIVAKAPATIDALSLKAVELAGARTMHEKKVRPRS